MPEPVLTVRGDFGHEVAELVAGKVAEIAGHPHESVRAIRVALDRLPDPAVTGPIAARVTVDSDGGIVHASAIARTAHDAMDLVISRVFQRIDDRPCTPATYELTRGHRRRRHRCQRLTAA